MPTDVAEPSIERDLRAEAHVRAISVSYRIVGVFVAVLTVWYVFAFWVFMYMPPWDLSLSLIGGAIAYLLLVATGAYTAGHFLWNYANAARWAVIVIGLISLAVQIVSSQLNPADVVWLVISLAWMGALAWALLNLRASRLFTPAYRDVVRRDTGLGPRWWASPFFYIPGCLIGLWIVVIILVMLV